MPYKLKCAVWEFTLKCNLRCSHCGSSAGIPRKDELTTKECYGLCEELSELGCEDVSLMGGEPFLRNDWISVGECIKDLGMNLNFVSNGTILDKYINNIYQLKPKVVGISIDGTKEIHESIRGKGTFEKAIKSIDLLRDKGIQTTVITTVSKLNFKDLPKLKDLFLKKNINWQIQIAMPFGNFQKDLMLTREEFYATALFIAKERINNRFEDLPVIGAHCFGYYSKILPGCKWDGCSAGVTAIGITSDGGIVGCLSMGNNRFIEANIRKKSLKNIWENPNNFAYNRKFDKSQLGENCINCKYGVKCQGGCNANSYTTTGIFHNNPYCFYNIEKNLIKL
jgi:radical SAM protein with 4Fe4S-binding SPASM domain